MKKNRRIEQTPTASEVSQCRLSNSRIMKIPQQERENIRKDVPLTKPVKSKTYNPHVREISDHGPKNPFDVPNRVRCFTKSQPKRKERPISFTMLESKTICDTDPEFYKIVDGRAVKPSNDIKVYLKNIGDIVLNKTRAAFLYDQILNIYTLLTGDELNAYNETYKLYHDTKINFQTFVAKTYKEAKLFEKLADQKALELNKISEQLETLSNEYVRLKNEVVLLSNTFETLSKYRRCLKMLTPLWWRAKHDPGFDENSFFLTKLFTGEESHELIYEKSITKLRDISTKLYFQKPEEIMQIFDDFSLQCLNYLEIKNHTSKILRPVLKCRDYLKISLRYEIEDMEEIISIYKEHVDLLEQKETDYVKTFNKLLMGKFQELYCSFDSVKLFTCVQYTHSTILEQFDDPNDNIKVLMKQIELYYSNAMLRLDHIDLKIVKKATKEAITRDKIMMEKAYSAQRILKNFDNFYKKLHTSFEPPRYKRK